ncbi:MAG: HEAT repeat domain-containing protein [bacterium]
MHFESAWKKYVEIPWVEFRQVFRPPEKLKKYKFSAFIFLLGLGHSCGFFSSDALLITRQGPSSLFLMYVVGSLLSLSLAGLLFLLVKKLSSFKVLRACFFAFGFVFLVAWIALTREISFPHFYLLLSAWVEASYLLTTVIFWISASVAFNAFQAKRNYPFLIAAGILGEMAGNFFVSVSSQKYGAQNFILVWSLALFSACFLFGRLSDFDKHPSHADKLRKPVNPELTDENEPLRLSSIRLTSLLFIFWLAFAFFSYGIDYLYNVKALEVFPNEDALASFFGIVGLAAGTGVLFYQLFIAAPLTLRFGIDRTIFLIPLLVVLGAALLKFSHTLGALAAAQAVVHYFADYVAAALVHPVLNVLSNKKRGFIEVFSEGFGKPAGTLFLFLFALAFSFRSDPSRMMDFLFVGSLMFLAFPFLFHRVYLRHLIHCLDSNDLHLVSNAVHALGERDKASAVSSLLKLLAESKNIQVKKNIVLSLGQMRSREAFQEILGLFSIRNEALQLAVVESLGRFKNYESIAALFQLLKSRGNVSFRVRMKAMRLLTGLVGKKMIPFLMESLQAPDLRIQANAIEMIGLLKDPRAFSVLVPFLTHEHHRIRANAAIALYRFRKSRSEAKKVIRELYASAEPLNRISALYAIGLLKLENYKSELISQLNSDDKKTLEFVTVALASMKESCFCVPFVRLLLDRDRGFAMGVLRHMSRFPLYSSLLVFEEIARLPEVQRQFIFMRLHQTGLDFSEEEKMVYGKDTVSGSTPHVPFYTFQEISR